MKPHITSLGVCQSLSFSFDFFGWDIKKFSCKSLLIAFKYSACFHVWYLTFIASYAKSIEKVRAIANDVLQIPSASNAKTVTLLATPVWNDGNHHDINIWSKHILFSTKESIIIFITCIITHTSRTIKTGGIFPGK
jgi:hypothetical protein